MGLVNSFVSADQVTVYSGDYSYYHQEGRLLQEKTYVDTFGLEGFSEPKVKHLPLEMVLNC